MRRTPCKAGCGRYARARRGARYCSPCIAKIPKKTCTSCGETFQADMMSGRRCRPCVSKAAHAKRIEETYGITAEQYAELLEFQDGACYICRRKPVSKRLAVDHDHATGLVRGLLCKACNRDVLGHLRDDAAALARAISYLSNPPAARLWKGKDRPREPV